MVARLCASPIFLGSGYAADVLSSTDTALGAWRYQSTPRINKASHLSAPVWLKGCEHLAMSLPEWFMPSLADGMVLSSRLMDNMRAWRKRTIKDDYFLH